MGLENTLELDEVQKIVCMPNNIKNKYNEIKLIHIDVGTPPNPLFTWT
jgi:hypothetical protein